MTRDQRVAKIAKHKADISGGSAKTKKANAAQHAKLDRMGLRQIGNRAVGAFSKKFAGRSDTKRTNAEHLAGDGWSTRLKRAQRSGTISGKKSVRDMLNAKAAKAAQRARDRAASKGTKKLPKAPKNAAKETFKQLRSEQRAARRKAPYLDGKSSWSKSQSGKAAATTRKLNRMVARRKR